MKKKLLEAKDKEFFDWLRLDVVDAKQAKLSRFKEHTETMKERVAFDSAKRTTQFAAIQDNIAMLFDSSSSNSLVVDLVCTPHCGIASQLKHLGSKPSQNTTVLHMTRDNHKCSKKTSKQDDRS